jgi:hypothetical protein
MPTWEHPLYLFQNQMENFAYVLIINTVTIQDPNLLPLMDELRDRVVGYEWFTKLKSKGEYYLVRLKDKESEDTMTMHTHSGYFKYKIIPVRLVNAPAIFQRMMNTIYNHCSIPEWYYTWTLF